MLQSISCLLQLRERVCSFVSRDKCARSCSLRQPLRCRVRSLVQEETGSKFEIRHELRSRYSKAVKSDRASKPLIPFSPLMLRVMREAAEESNIGIRLLICVQPFMLRLCRTLDRMAPTKSCKPLH